MLLLTAVIGEATRSGGPSCTDPSGEAKMPRMTWRGATVKLGLERWAYDENKSVVWSIVNSGKYYEGRLDLKLLVLKISSPWLLTKMKQTIGRKISVT